MSQCSSSPEHKKKSETAASSSKSRSPKDWICPECNQSVFKWRHKCFFCDTPRPNGGEISPVLTYEELSDQDKTDANILAKTIRDRLCNEENEWLPIDHIGGWLSQVDPKLRSVITKLGGFAAYLKTMSDTFELSTWNPCDDASSIEQTPTRPRNVKSWIRLTESAKKNVSERVSLSPSQH